jgi:hypothetical protein
MSNKNNEQNDESNPPTEVSILEEQTKIEIENGGNFMGISATEALDKFKEICEENGMEVSNPMALGLWRNYAAQFRRQKNTPANSGGFSKSAFGFFISLEEPRDTMAWNRKKVIDAYRADKEDAFDKGLFAQVFENTSGQFEITRNHKGDEQKAIVSALPKGTEEIDGDMFVPLDSQEFFMNGGTNKGFGKALPVKLMRRTGIFVGQVGDSTEMKPYFFSYKKVGCIDFAPNTFEFIHMKVILNDNGTDIYGFTGTTRDSLVMNVDLDPENSDYRDMSDYDFSQAMIDLLPDKVITLVDLEQQHMSNQMLPSKDRYVITDGTVCNMNMTPFGNGNRVINLTDLSTEFDYETDGGMTTCWMPSNINIDFGIGSTVVVIGRTSQRITDEGPQPITINVSGVLVLNRIGLPAVVEGEEDSDFDWL